MSWTVVADVLAAIFLLCGAFLAFAAGVGVVRFPDLLARMHAATKPQVLGLILVLIALALRIRSWSAVGMLVLVVICTIGVCAMAVGIFRGQRWARSGGIVVQVLVLAIAGGAAADQFGDVSLALKIGIPALVTFAILIAEVRSVGRAEAAEEA